MTKRIGLVSLLFAGAAATMIGGLAAPALAAPAPAAAAMSAEDFMTAANANADKTLSMDEVDAYAKKRFAQIESDHDKTLDQKELAGRLSEAGMTMADKDKDKTIDEAEFVDYANTLFGEANTHKESGHADHPTLSLSELRTPAGQKLIMLLH